MYNWEEEINRECKAQTKRWNGKVISTGRQWTENANGAIEPMATSYNKMYDAVRDYYTSREWD